MKKTLDICILTAGEHELFSQCVDAVMRQWKPEYQLYVHVNNMDKDMRQPYEEIFKRLPKDSKTNWTREDWGFPMGANKVINMGNSNLVLFITDDVELTDGAIEILISRMKSDEDISQVGLKLLFPENSQDNHRPAGRVQHVGLGMDIRGNIIHPLVGWTRDNPKCCVSREVYAVTGATFMIRRKAFKEAGGFDTVYGRGTWEDVDVSLRMRSLGYKIFIDTDAVAYHKVGATAVNQKKPFPLEQNKAIFTQKWHKSFRWTSWEFM